MTPSNLLSLFVCLCVLDWAYARLCLRDERRWRKAHNERLRKHMREHGCKP